MTDGLRIAHSQDCPLEGNPEVGNPEGNHILCLKHNTTQHKNNRTRYNTTYTKIQQNIRITHCYCYCYCVTNTGKARGKDVEAGQESLRNIFEAKTNICQQGEDKYCSETNIFNFADRKYFPTRRRQILFGDKYFQCCG